MICVLAAVLCAALFPLLLLNPGYYVDTYGVEPDAGASFLGRRASPLFLGLAVMLWMMRDLPRGTARDAVSIGMAFTWGGIAATGLFAFSTGTANANILIAAVVETAMAVSFVIARRR